MPIGRRGYHGVLARCSPRRASTPLRAASITRRFSKCRRPIVKATSRPADGARRRRDLRKLRGAGYLDVAPVLIDIAQALEYAHEHGVIHRDLEAVECAVRCAWVNPAHGLRYRLGARHAERRSIRPGLSPFTASPAQLRGDPPSMADDIYGLDAPAYELPSAIRRATSVSM